MSLSVIDFFDKGVALDPERACLVFGEQVASYAQAQAGVLLGEAPAARPSTMARLFGRS